MDLNVSRETTERLEAFQALVKKWTKSINLIAPNTVADMWTRHIVDSIQLYPLAPDSYTNWADLGSGGGFPGIALAIMAREQQTNAVFTLIESDTRKATFLRTAARELELNVRVLDERLEIAAPQDADVVSARALSPLDQLFTQIERHIHPDGVSIIPKGRNFQAEIDQAKQNWSFELELVPSKTDAEAKILIVRGLNRERL